MHSGSQRANLSKRRAAIAEMFDRVAPRYDLVNRLLSLGQVQHWRSQMVATVKPAPGQLILDLAAGTGTSSRPFTDAGATVVSADLSLGMLTVGKLRQPELAFVNADALALPFPDETFDTVTISFGLRNVEDVQAALTEMHRVTRPGGLLVVCEFSTPTWQPLREIYCNYLAHTFPRIAKLTSTNPGAYDYLVESILAWPDQQSLALEMTNSGWLEPSWRNLSGGIVALHRATR